MKREVIISGIVLILLISIASAGIWDSVKKVITGNPVGPQSQNVSVTVAGTHLPTIDEPSAAIAAQIPTENGITTVTFNVDVSDDDYVANIVDSSLLVQVSRGAIIKTATCGSSTNLDLNTKRFSCTINMNYYDEAGTWDFYAEIRDQESNLATKSIISYFVYNLLPSFSAPLTPSSLTWPSLTPGGLNINSSNDPTIVTNTGNYRGNIKIQAYNLVGETNNLENIPATAFSVSGTSGSECTAGVALGPDSAPSVDTSIYANPGVSGSNTASIYYCITSVPTVSSQVYSTTARGQSWTVSY
jgi:hypothetical protein